MFVKVYGCAISGIEAQLITIEVNVTRGAKIHMVGLPDNAVRESHQRSWAMTRIINEIPYFVLQIRPSKEKILLNISINFIGLYSLIALS